MPMSWAGTPLKKNDMRRVLAGVLTAMFGGAPASPSNAVTYKSVAVTYQGAAVTHGS